MNDTDLMLALSSTINAINQHACAKGYGTSLPDNSCEVKYFERISDTDTSYKLVSEILPNPSFIVYYYDFRQEIDCLREIQKFRQLTDDYIKEYGISMSKYGKKDFALIMLMRYYEMTKEFVYNEDNIMVTVQSFNDDIKASHEIIQILYYIEYFNAYDSFTLDNSQEISFRRVDLTGNNFSSSAGDSPVGQEYGSYVTTPPPPWL
ncbi:MAG: hypothetical protein ACYC6A_26035 [Armatimonadota bacterium]